MTSKICFSKICVENLRHRAAFVIVTVFLYLIQLLSFVMQFQNAYAYGPTPQELRASIETITSPGVGVVLIPLLAGIYLAFDGLCALHSRARTDLFGSLPLKRKTEYQMILLNSFLIILIPAAIYTGIEVIILGAAGQLSGTVIRYILLSFLFSLLAFLSSWVTAALAIIMTGHSFVGLLGFGVFAAYMPLIIAFLIPLYANTFFQTCSLTDLCDFFSSMLNYFSPFSLSFGIVDSAGNVWSLGEHLGSIIGIVIWIIVIGMISYVLYIRRPAEAAGRAMAFEKANPVIRFLIVIPMALYTGLYLQQMAFSSSLIWLFAGIAGGAVVFHSIVECIYQFDIRGILSYKKQLAATILICFAFTAVFMADIFGYDKWMPKKENLASMDITFDYMSSQTDRYWGQKPDGITGDTLDAAMELIADATANVRQTGSSSSDAVGSFSIADSDDSGANTASITVTYKMKDGKQKKRNYTIDTETQKALIDQVYSTEDFKNDYYSLYTADRSNIKKIEWENSLEYDTLKLSEAEQNEFIDTYLEELTAMSYSDTLKMGACSMFSVTHGKAFLPYLNSYSSDVIDDYYIYPTFTKTLAFLEKKGYSANPLKDHTISKLVLTVSDAEYENESTYTITDADTIKKYADSFIMTVYDGYYADFDDHYLITAYVKTPDGYTTLDLRVTTKVGEKLLEKAKK